MACGTTWNVLALLCGPLALRVLSGFIVPWREIPEWTPPALPRLPRACRSPRNKRHAAQEKDARMSSRSRGRFAPGTVRGMLRALPSVIVVSACIAAALNLAYDPRISALSFRKIDGIRISAAMLCCAAAQLLYFTRWHWLLRVVSVPLTWVAAVTAAAVAQLFGSLALGVAAGDVYRGISVGSRCPGHRVGLVTSILADRVSGIYAIVCLASLAAVPAAAGNDRWNAIRTVALPVLWTAAATGALCIAGGLFANLGPMLAFTRQWPTVHKAIVPILTAIERFRSRPWIYVAAVLVGIAVHALNAAGFWLLAGGLSLPHPSLVQHCLILPLVTCTGLLPLPLAGLGAVELMIDQLYQAAVPGAQGAGVLASLVFRGLSLGANAAIAAILVASASLRADDAPVP